MLTLSIKRKWYNMILSGKKKEEYREIKPYYTKRFANADLLKKEVDTDGNINFSPTMLSHSLIIRNGYSATSAQALISVHLEIKTGNPNWGAEPGKFYYCLCIESIDSVRPDYELVSRRFDMVDRLIQLEKALK